MSIMKKILVLLLVSCSIYASDTNLVLNNTWNAERYLEQNKELPYSVFTINLKVNTNNKVVGSYCFVTRWGRKIDCFTDDTNNIHGVLKNKKIEVIFDSSWGGKNGRANITIDEHCNLKWELLKDPDGLFYIPKKSLLLSKKKTGNCNSLIDSKKDSIKIIELNLKNKINVDRYNIEYFQNINLGKKNLIAYNNIAYYLEKAKAYPESIYLLEKILKKYPNRTVAYINLGDAYWGLKNKEKAKQAYSTYIKQMKEKGKERKIPKVVLERIK
ncbi:tetratricopeptide repeat protein [Sulfurimonas sp.]|uniref:tetratricopeptide repeat protein n=1 Tax=Sulfurimonas sp. TaxID=2022749 RepID=UPI002B4A717A|nr:tetratricopeptide repeat protein [Sulfurimonas sp.]